MTEYDSSSGDITPVKVILADLKNSALSVVQEQKSLKSSHEEMEIHTETLMKELANSKHQVSLVSYM